MAVEVIEQVLELPAGHAHEVVERPAAEEGEGDVVGIQLVAQQGGVVEDAGVVGLPHHVGEPAAADADIEGCLQVFGGEGGTLGRVHWRQLGVVANQQQPVVGGGIDVVEEVLQQAAHPRQFARVRLGGDHRGLVHDEECVAVLVLLAQEHPQSVARGHAVYPLVDGVGLAPRILGDDLGRAPRGSKQHRAHPHIVQCLHQRAYQTRFACARIALQNEQQALALLVDEVRQRRDALLLAARGREAEVLSQRFLELGWAKHKSACRLHKGWRGQYCSWKIRSHSALSRRNTRGSWPRWRAMLSNSALRS